MLKREKRFSSLKLQPQASEEDVVTISEPGDDDAHEKSVAASSENLNRAAAYKELNASSSSKQSLAHLLEGVDLQLLTKSLLPEAQIKEVDVPWNWDVLFAEMVPDLCNE